METILRSEEMAEIMLLPVRHHSLACSLQLQKVIESWDPSAILVEGPQNANALLPIMVHEDTHAPFAIYYAYHDKAKILSEEQEHYKCYYPFLEYSPELHAVREAAHRGIEAAFIDLSYGDILAASAKGKGLLKEEGKNSYNDDYLLSRNTYIEKLCEKANLRSFDEFWEKYFELNGLYEDSQTWFSHLLTYCTLARQNTPLEVLQEEGCIDREAHMAAKIVQWVVEKSKAKENKRLLVVTGGFHTPALAERLSGKQWAQTKRTIKKRSGKVSDKDQSVYLMPYSMEAADALNGYASGMPFVGFYQKVWEGKEETQKPYQKAVLDMLVLSGKEVRKKEGYLSTYDEICAWQMAQGLSNLRQKPQPGAYELLDAARSCYVKGECNIASDLPLRILRRMMIGEGTGTLCSQAEVPPILQDFEAQCKSFRLKIHATLETEMALSIFSEPKHRKISQFFHRTLFLETTFAKRTKGPNLQLKRDKNLIREIWKYKWNEQVPSMLIDVSVHGATIEEAAGSLVQERLKKELGAGSAAKLLTQVFEMGLSKQLEAVYAQVDERILVDTDFYSIAEALNYLMMMQELSGLYDSQLALSGLLHNAVYKLITILPSMTGIKDENLASCMDVLKLLYRITGKSEDMEREKELYYEALKKMLQDLQIHAGLHGCILGILYGSGRETSAHVETACRGYLTGTREQLMQTAVFFRGLFYTAKDLIFIGGHILTMLDKFFGEVNKDEFMELLPQLRMAFTYFTPSEIDRIAHMAAKLHGKQGADIMERCEILPEWYAYGKELDEYVKLQMENS